MNFDALDELARRHPDLDLVFLESGGDNLAASFSPELVDAAIYVIDVSGGDKIPRKGGPGVTRSDLLVINKIDLAPHVGASLDVMARDAKAVRGDRPFVFTNLKTGDGVRGDRRVDSSASCSSIGRSPSVDRRDAGAIGRTARLELVFAVPRRAHRPDARVRRAAVPRRRVLPDGDGAHMILAWSAPGVFGGDCLEQRVRVERGASVRLTSQSALQAHPVAWRSGRDDAHHRRRRGRRPNCGAIGIR